MTAGKSVYLETMGCQMNALDSELILGELMAQGYSLTDDFADAGIVILNTCSVRQHAEDKVYSRLGQIRGTRSRKPDQVLAVVGCMAERDAAGLLARVPEIDILCGPNELHHLVDLLEDVRRHRHQAVALSGRDRDRSTSLPGGHRHQDLESLDSSRFFGLSDHAPVPRVFGRYQAYVRVTRGCNKYCSFCVVPYVRGPEVHRSPEAIIQEVRRFADAGVVEVTLLGQTVNHYRYPGDAKTGETSFARLLQRVHDEVPHLPRLRFVTSYPRDFDDATLEVIAESPRICRYLHLPAQSGSDRILKQMNRGYTVSQYMTLLDRARKILPDVSIAGDMIVGFSGETDDDYAASLELLRHARYKNCYVFKYSPRPGTAAETRLPDDVPDEVKRRRNNGMLAVQAEINLAHHRALVGQEVEVLVEGPSKAALKGREPEQGREAEVSAAARANASASGAEATAIQLVGRTRGDQIVVFDGMSDMVGRLLAVRINAATPYTLHGQARITPGPSGLQQGKPAMTSR